MKTVCIHQPDFLPWLGFFDRLRKCDLYVVLDNVQFLRRGWHHRDKIKSASGEVWLTIPVKKSGRFEQLISETEIDNSTDWRSQHLGSLRACYGRAPFFSKIFPSLEAIYNKDHNLLADFNLELLRFLMEALDTKTEMVFASKLATEGRKNELLLSILQSVEGTHYLSGTGAKAYLEESAFKERGITVQWQEFSHPKYPQLFGDFLPGLSSIDFLFNTGDKLPL